MTRGRRTVAGVLTILVLATGGCSANSSGAGRPVQSPTGSAAAPGPDLAYGRAPTAGGDIVYQPDVVLVGGGASSIRAVSRDYLTWTIDDRAPHADQLAVGKVMFLTDRAVGRVMALRRQGDDLAVTLGPVELGDVIRDGTLAVNQTVGANALAPLTYDGAGGLADVTELTGQATPTPTPASAQTPTSSFVPASLRLPRRAAMGSAASVTVGDFTLAVSNSDKEGIALRIAYEHEGLIFAGVITVGYSDLKVDADLRLKGGKLVNGSRLLVSGIKKVTMSTEGGSEQGLSRNVKARIEVPIDDSIEIPSEPVPMVLSIKMRFILETAFSAKNGNLTADGELAVDGPIGFTYNDGFTPALPSVTQVKSPVDTMSGVSIGVNAVVFAWRVRVGLGIGIPVASVGPFAALITSFGMTLGSSAGIVQCRQMSLDVLLTVGVGLALDATELGWFESVYSAIAPKTLSYNADLISTDYKLVHLVAYKPPVTACG